jgi:acyl-CoA reductase-like NAD-dependent aldehyde dehydrogenase
MPLGVVGAISAWNVPMILLAAKIAPALLAGNTVVAKPAATTPLAALKLGELCADILPPGVINVIVDANDLGGALTAIRTSPKSHSRARLRPAGKSWKARPAR